VNDDTMPMPDLPSGRREAVTPGRGEQPSVSATAPGQLPSVPTSQPGLSQIAVDAYVTFYRDFVADLVAFLVWQGARLADAVDLAQEAMTEAYRSWSAIKHPRAWAKRVASRKYARLIAQAEEPIESANLSLLLPPSLDISKWEERHEVLRSLNLLPPRQRQVMAWTCDGYTPSEIAAELNMNAEAVRANLMRARRTLAAHLALPQERPQDCGLPKEEPQCGGLPEEGPQ
jgi:RNA polymerase sigma factor (sigma-70 family)